MDLSQPLRLQLLGVGHRARIVAKEIHGAEGVAFVPVVVELAHRIVGSHCVRQTIVKSGGTQRIGAIVGGEPFAVATNRIRRSESAARDLKTDWAYVAGNLSRQKGAVDVCNR